MRLAGGDRVDSLPGRARNGDLLALACMGASAVMLGWPRDLPLPPRYYGNGWTCGWCWCRCLRWRATPRSTRHRYTYAASCSQRRPASPRAQFAAGAVDAGTVNTRDDRDGSRRWRRLLGASRVTTCVSRSCWVEVIDPGESVSWTKAMAGEVVFSTLNRVACR